MKARVRFRPSSRDVIAKISLLRAPMVGLNIFNARARICFPDFRSMKITEDVDDYAAEPGIEGLAPATESAEIYAKA
jgi:hypothetical protein